MQKKISDGAAVAMKVLLIPTMPNSIRIFISISDCNYTKLIWNFEGGNAGDLGSTAGGISYPVFKAAVKKMPYYVK
jgi:hypothetical protein